MNKYKVWMEGSKGTGSISEAIDVSSFHTPPIIDAISFEDACKIALINAEYDLSFYDEKKLTWFGCRLFGNEKDARERYG